MEKTKKVFFVNAYTVLVVFILPIIGMIFVIPKFLHAHMTEFDGF